MRRRLGCEVVRWRASRGCSWRGDAGGIGPARAVRIPNSVVRRGGHASTDALPTSGDRVVEPPASARRAPTTGPHATFASPRRRQAPRAWPLRLDRPRSRRSPGLGRRRRPRIPPASRRAALRVAARAGRAAGRRRSRGLPRAGRRRRRRCRRPPTATRRAACSSRPPSRADGSRRGAARAELPGRRRAGASTLLEDEPREPVLLNLAGVAALRAGRDRAAEALFRGAPPGPRAAGRRSATCASARAAAAQGTATPQGLPAAVAAPCCATSRRAPSASPRAARPATGLTLSLCMIVKDEEAMLAALPGRRRATPSTRCRRRHGLDRPDGRDRRVLRRARPAPRVDRRLLRGPQRLLRRRHQRLADVPRRRRGARRRATPSACAR